MDLIDVRVVPLDHQAKRQAGLTKPSLQCIGDILLCCLVSSDRTEAVIGRYQHQLRVRCRSVEHLSRRSVQKRSPSLFGYGPKTGVLGPAPQRSRVTHEWYATLDEKPGEFLRRAGMGSTGC